MTYAHIYRYRAINYLLMAVASRRNLNICVSTPSVSMSSSRCFLLMKSTSIVHRSSFDVPCNEVVVVYIEMLFHAHYSDMQAKEIEPDCRDR